MRGEGRGEEGKEEGGRRRERGEGEGEGVVIKERSKKETLTFLFFIFPTHSQPLTPSPFLPHPHTWDLSHITHHAPLPGRDSVNKKRRRQPKPRRKRSGNNSGRCV